MMNNNNIITTARGMYVPLPSFGGTAVVVLPGGLGGGLMTTGAFASVAAPFEAPPGAVNGSGSPAGAAGAGGGAFDGALGGT